MTGTRAQQMFVGFSVFESLGLNPLSRDSTSVTPERARWLGCLVDLLKTGDTGTSQMALTESLAWNTDPNSL